MIRITKVTETLIHFEIKQQNSSKTIIDDGELSDDLFSQIISALADTVCSHEDPRHIINMKSMLQRYYTSSDKQNIWGHCIAKSKFHEFVCANIEDFNSKNEPTELQWERMKSIYTACVSASDKSSEFCLNIRGTDLPRLLTQNLYKLKHYSELDDANDSELAESALLILHNTFRYADTFQNELFATKELKRILPKFLNYPNDGVKMAAFVILAIGNEITRLDKQPDTATLIMNYINQAWMSNNRRYNGCHLEELLSGLYYALQSDEVKRLILTQTNLDTFYDIIELLESPTEVRASLTIIKQIAKSPNMKQALKFNYKLTSFLNNLDKNKMPAIVPLINDLIEELGE